jgi:hypothetical protein
VRTRNARLSAIHSFFQYAAMLHPEHAELIQRVLAIPEKHFDTALVAYLTPLEIDALPTPAASTASDITALVGDQAFDWLDAPIRRVRTRSVAIPYDPVMERSVVTAAPQIIGAVREALRAG